MRETPTIDAKSMLVGWLVLLLSWAAVSYLLDVPEYFLASPHRVAAYFAGNPQLLIRAFALTASESVIGWALAAVLGVAVGAGIYYLPWGRRIALPPLVALQTTPIIALAPLVTFAFGYGWWSKTVVAAIVALLPVVFATYSGLGGASRTHLHIYRLCGASEFRIFREVRLRSAWSSVLASLEVAAVFAVIGSIVAEFMGGTTGLGHLILRATGNSLGHMLIAAVILSAVLGQLLLRAVGEVAHVLRRRLGE